MLKEKQKSDILFLKQKQFKKVIHSDRTKSETLNKIEKEYANSNSPLKKLPLYSTLKKWGISFLSASVVTSFALSMEMLRELATGTGLNIPMTFITVLSYLLLCSMFFPVSNNRQHLIDDVKDKIFLSLEASDEAISLFKEEMGLDAYRGLLYFNPIITNDCLLKYEDVVKEMYFKKISKMNEIKKIGNSF